MLVMTSCISRSFVWKQMVLLLKTWTILPLMRRKKNAILPLMSTTKTSTTNLVSNDATATNTTKTPTTNTVSSTTKDTTTTNTTMSTTKNNARSTDNLSLNTKSATSNLSEPETSVSRSKAGMTRKFSLTRVKTDEKSMVKPAANKRCSVHRDSETASSTSGICGGVQNIGVTSISAQTYCDQLHSHTIQTHKTRKCDKTKTLPDVAS